MNKIIHGDSLIKLKELEDNSVDAIITDPPYELGFMGKKWDNSGIAYNVELWKECLRVLKPGGHLCAFSATRTYHRMAVAIENAGFEIRDIIEWVYNSGFPKSQNIGKMYDKKMGNEREVVGKTLSGNKDNAITSSLNNNQGFGHKAGIVEVTKGTSPYEGQGTSLKPAHEPICLARKPLSEKTILGNVEKWGTGGIAIDDCRIPCADKAHFPTGEHSTDTVVGKIRSEIRLEDNRPEARFPANIICQDDALNDGEISGGGSEKPCYKDTFGDGNIYGKGNGAIIQTYSDKGSKSRFFDLDVWYEKNGLLQFSKTSTSEKNAGCEELPDILDSEMTNRKEGSKGLDWNNGKGGNAFAGASSSRLESRKNNHPTVKPIKLMSWLIRLVAPKEGMVVLDPFAGSGTTLCACIEQNRQYIGIELTKEYIPLIEARVEHYKHKQQQTQKLWKHII